MSKTTKPRKSQEILINQGMLNEFRAEVLSRFHWVDHKFNLIVEELKSFRDEVRGNLRTFEQELKADNMKTRSEIFGVRLLVEEQQARNKFVLDGYTNLYDRVEKLEKDGLK